MINSVKKENPWGLEDGTILRIKNRFGDLFKYEYNPNHDDEGWYLWNGLGYMRISDFKKDDFDVVDPNSLSWYERNRIS